MRVVTLNLNGIRAAARKGFYTWFEHVQPDVMCLQETKAQLHQLEDEMFHPAGYHGYFFDAEKKGYSGVAIYTRHKPQKVHTGLGFPLADTEGRYLQVDFSGLSVASLYLPSGTSGDIRQNCKYEFLDFYADHLQALRRKRREYIICGDFNIAHKQIDIRNWRANQKHSGFLPEERQWLDHVFDELGYVDAFRQVNTAPDMYTWWSNRGQAWANNVGWRIDYQIVTPGLADSVKAADIYKEERFSDHAPLVMDYAVPEALV